MTTNFEDITNHIAYIIENDADIQLYSQTNLGNTLIGVDNPVIIEGEIERIPYFVIAKHDEPVFRNDKAISEGKSNIWYMTIVFIGDFSVEQINNDEFKIPINAKQTINGIMTFTPSDYMRIIARKAGELITEKVGCGLKTAGVTLSMYSINSDDYYANGNGVVTSQLFIEVYKRANYSN